MIKVLKHVRIYDPEDKGVGDILICGEKIARVAPHIDEYDGLPEVEIFDFTGKTAVPGYVDLHEHITGGGGEQGPSSRVPELQLGEVIRAGVTTVVGLLGTDGITRSVENLLAKCRSFNDLGITCYMLTGAYGYPSPTITGAVERDVALISECIGVKIAVSDHRSSDPGPREISDVATAARRGGMLGGSAGLTVMHMGGGKEGLKPVLDLLDSGDIPAKNLLPTHMGRTAGLLEQGKEFIKRGGTIDITCGSSEKGSLRTAGKIAQLYREGVDFSHVTSSSDGCGSMPKFDGAGNCVGMTYASPLGLHRQMKCLITDCGVPVSDALRIQTVNPAAVLGKTGIKGVIRPGADGDILIWNEDYDVESVFAKGKTGMLNGTVFIKGRFED